MACSPSSRVLYCALVSTITLEAVPAHAAGPKPFSERVVLPITLGAEPFRTLAALTEAVPRLAEAGAEALLVARLYAGTVRPPHAVVDHLTVAPELGDEAAFRRLAEAAHVAGLTLILDLHANDVSVAHPWFTAARAGDRFHRGLFVLSAEPPDGGEAQLRRWSFDEALRAHYYHARGPGRADLNLRDAALRARIVAFAEQWRGRGARGFRVLAARHLVEEVSGPTLDHAENLTLFSELHAKLGPEVGLIAALRAPSPVAARYFGERAGGATLVTERDRAVGLADALQRGHVELLAATLERSERSRGDRGQWALALPEAPWVASAPAELSAAFLLTAGGQPWLEPEWLGSPLVASLLARRRRHVALERGATELVLGGPEGALVFTRREGADVVLVALGFAEGQRLELGRLGELGRRLALEDAVQRGVTLAPDRTWVELGRGAVFVAPVTPPGPSRVVEMTREAGSGRPLEVIAEPGGAFDERRGLGFDEDRRAELRCAVGGRGGPRCFMPFEGAKGYTAGARYTLAVAPGAHRVELRLRGRARAGDVQVEGEPAAPSKAGASHLVFVRDGRLSIEAAPGAHVEVERITVAPAPLGEVSLTARPDGRVLLIESPLPGELLWRMDESSTEPVERTPLVRAGRVHTARLGPWPEGVRSVKLLLRDTKGRLHGGPGGREIELSVPGRG